jgi:glutamyl-Q tRNA(Asp) synthetase
MPEKNTHTPIGRFAPSPTGPLHFGSLIAAVASYLSVRSSDEGKWLLRIEDLDTQRSHPHHSDSIIKSLAQYGFKWDDDITFQSDRTKAYQEAFELLQESTFPCSCTRKSLKSALNNTDSYHYIYPGFCRDAPAKLSNKKFSYRLKVGCDEICFYDQIQGSYSQNLSKEVGDFVLKQADNNFTYQLAVVVDDHWQGINQIIRGADLLDNTPRQIYLQHLLNYQTPIYGHFPVITTIDGKKLSKQNAAPEIGDNNKRALLIKALTFLGQTPPNLSDFSNLDDLWAFAVQNWDQRKIPRVLTQVDNLE